MEQTIHSPETYDFRKYDQIWQRVAPNLEPYPDLREPAVPAAAPLTSGAAASGGQAVTAEEVLPGAEKDPCCMGTAAREEVEVIEGFIEAELADRRMYQVLAQRAPASARRTMRDLAAASGEAARRLLAARYLITGTCYRPAVACGRITVGSWCPVLRERYHVEACNGMNYLRAGEETTDPCLGRLLKELGEASYRQADALMALLEREL